MLFMSDDAMFAVRYFQMTGILDPGDLADQVPSVNHLDFRLIMHELLRWLQLEAKIARAVSSGTAYIDRNNIIEHVRS